MNRLLLGTMISFALTLAVHAESASNPTRQLGRRGTDNVTPQVAVPDSSPTLALLFIGMVSVAAVGIALTRKSP